MKKNQYKDSKRHGIWEQYHSDGNIMFKGYYKDGELHGYWEFYWYFDEVMLYKEFYI